MFKIKNIQDAFNQALSLVYIAYHYFLEWCAMNW